MNGWTRILSPFRVFDCLHQRRRVQKLWIFFCFGTKNSNAQNKAEKQTTQAVIVDYFGTTWPKVLRFWSPAKQLSRGVHTIQRNRRTVCRTQVWHGPRMISRRLGIRYASLLPNSNDAPFSGGLLCRVFFGRNEEVCLVTFDPSSKNVAKRFKRHGLEASSTTHPKHRVQSLGDANTVAFAQTPAECKKGKDAEEIDTEGTETDDEYEELETRTYQLFPTTKSSTLLGSV